MIKCKFHPTSQSKHYCHHCDIYLCDKCADDAPLKRDSAALSNCFICESVLDPSSSESRIAPFWSRLSEIYQYPLSPHGIAAIIIVAIMSVVLGGGLFFIIPAVAMNLYSFACLRRSADGENDSPGVEAIFDGSVMTVVYVIISTFLAMFGAGLVFATFGVGAGIIASLFLAIMMPAMVIDIAIEEHLLPALNPLRLVSIVRATGASYFVMVLFVLVMLSSMAVLSSFFADTNFQSLSIFLTSLIGNYYSIVVYHIMGYLVYQNHVELGYRVSGSAGIQQVKTRNLRQRQEAQLGLLIKAGKFDAARDLAKRIIKNDSPMWQWEQVFKLYCAAKPSVELDSYFDRYVTRLSQIGGVDKIADAYLQLIKVKPTFTIKKETQKIQVADALQQVGKPAQAIKLLQKLPIESSDNSVIKQALSLLVASFEQIPNGQKHVDYFSAQYSLHLEK